jgi:hypothetical protein
MSAWKVACRALHALGGVATRQQLEDYIVDDPYGGLVTLRRYGMVTMTPAATQFQPATFTLTELGLDWIEGRRKLSPVPTNRAMLALLPTWLSALPRDVRITEPA